jgi:Protein kinase domain
LRRASSTPASCRFGLLKHFDSSDDLTRTGQFVGTIPYVAPEQIEGRTLDGRVDVYALGCVLFQSLTGALPFDRDSDVAVVYAHLQDPPPSATRLRPELPAGLDELFARALAKAPGDRFATATELVTAARAVLGSQPQTEPWSFEPGRASTGGVAGPGRRRLAAPLVGLVLLAALAGGGLLAADRLGYWPARLPAAAGEAGTDLAQPGSAGGQPTRTCASGWQVPVPRTPLRAEPLDHIRAAMGVTGAFLVAEMRSFRGADGSLWWYVKASRDADRSFRARWLVVRQPDGVRRVAAVAPYETEGLRSPDWRAFSGQGGARRFPGVPGTWRGSPVDFVAAGGLPRQVRGCLAGT